MCKMCEAKEAAQTAIDSNDPAAQTAALAKLNGTRAAFFSSDLVAACSQQGPVVATLGVAHALGLLAAAASLDIEVVIEAVRAANVTSVQDLAKAKAELEASLPPFLVEVMKSKAPKAEERSAQFTAAREAMNATFAEAQAQQEAAASQPGDESAEASEPAPAPVSQDDREGVTVTPA